MPANLDEANVAQRKRKRASPEEFTQVGGIKVQKPDDVAPDRTFLRRLDELCQMFNDSIRASDQEKAYKQLIDLESLYPDGGPTNGYVELQEGRQINGKDRIKMTRAEWQQIAKMKQDEIDKLKAGDSVRIIHASQEMELFKSKVGYAQKQLEQLKVIDEMDA